MAAKPRVVDFRAVRAQRAEPLSMDVHLGRGGFKASCRLVSPALDIRRCPIEHDRPMLVLTNLYVHPLRRQRGWARELVGMAKRTASTLNYDLCLFVLPWGEVAGPSRLRLREFYLSCGFRPVKVSPWWLLWRR